MLLIQCEWSPFRNTIFTVSDIYAVKKEATHYSEDNGIRGSARGRKLEDFVVKTMTAYIEIYIDT